MTFFAFFTAAALVFCSLMALSAMIAAVQTLVEDEGDYGAAARLTILAIFFATLAMLIAR